MIAGAIVLMASAGRADAEEVLPPTPDIPPVPAETPEAAPAAEPPGDASNLVLPDDTHEEGQSDPIARINELQQRLDQMQELVANRQPRVIVGGYVDLGFFATQGNGSGIVRDQGNVAFPQYAGKYGWVFLGDILAPAVNSRGEVADLGDATGAVAALRHHPLGRRAWLHRQRDQPEADLGAGDDARSPPPASTSRPARARTSAWATSSTSTSRSSSGCRPARSRRRSSSASSTRSWGSSTASARSNQRFGITPSLISRYTTGTALGVKVRSQVRPRRHAGAGRRRHQRLVHHRAVPLLQRDRHQPRQDAPAAALSLHPPIPAGHGARRLGHRTARRTARPTTPARCGSGASTASCTCAASTSRRSTCGAPPPATP